MAAAAQPLESVGRLQRSQTCKTCWYTKSSACRQVLSCTCWRYRCTVTAARTAAACEQSSLALARCELVLHVSASRGPVQGTVECDPCSGLRFVSTLLIEKLLCTDDPTTGMTVEWCAVEGSRVGHMKAESMVRFSQWISQGLKLPAHVQLRIQRGRRIARCCSCHTAPFHYLATCKARLQCIDHSKKA